MVYIVHGEDYPKSRKLISNQQSKLETGSRIELDAVESTPQKLLESVCTSDLFGNFPFVVLNITDLPSNKTNNIKLNKFVKIVASALEKATIIVLSGKDLGKTHPFIKSAPKLRARVVHNKTTPVSNVFNLVDALFSKNTTATYKQLRLLELENTDPFYIFSMVLYGLRNVAHSKFESIEFSKKSPYIQSKTKTQALNFTRLSILTSFKKLYEIEKKLKTGQISPEIALTYSVEYILSA